MSNGGDWRGDLEMFGLAVLRLAFVVWPPRCQERASTGCHSAGGSRRVTRPLGLPFLSSFPSCPCLSLSLLLFLFSLFLPPSSSPYIPSPPRQKCAGTQTTCTAAPTPTTAASSASVPATTALPADPSSSSPIRAATPSLPVPYVPTTPSTHGPSFGDVWMEYGPTSHQASATSREACSS